MPRRRTATGKGRYKQALLKNQVENTLKKEGYKHISLVSVVLNIKLTDYEQITRGEHYILYKHKNLNRYVVYIGVTYYHLKEN